jgi:hypothetical protein
VNDNPDAYRVRGRTVSSAADRLLLAWDLGIIGLVSLNLALILFDSLFLIPPLSNAMETVLPTAHGWYNSNIHERFFEIDLVFVSIFIVDVLAGWALAIKQQRYQRWYFYPFAHWYDVLGCIPLSGFRLLRVLRVISILFRLQRLGYIDVRNWAVYRTLMVYYGIFVEEISDRVVINVLSGVQEEIQNGGGGFQRQLVQEVLLPRRELLAQSIAQRVEVALDTAYTENREQIHGYIGHLVENSVRDNAAVRNLERLPMVGQYAIQAVEDAITDAINGVIEDAINGLDSEEFDEMVSHITDSVFRMLMNEQADGSGEINRAVIETLELVKAQVAVKRWKENF